MNVRKLSSEVDTNRVSNNTYLLFFGSITICIQLLHYIENVTYGNVYSKSPIVIFHFSCPRKLLKALQSHYERFYERKWVPSPELDNNIFKISVIVQY